jgi:glutathione S-transferase
MSKLKLWGHPRSINVQKVLWSLDELGLPYEREDAGAGFGKVREPWFLALNPNGLVPTLEVDGAPLWESNAIVRFLFAAYGSAPLHPADGLARARADQFADWKSSTLWPATRTLLVQLIRTAEPARDAKVIELAHDQANRAFQILDGVLAQHAYVVSNDFTWADIPLGAAAQRYLHLPIKRPFLPNVSAWYTRISARPAFQRWVDLPLA